MERQETEMRSKKKTSTIDENRSIIMEKANINRKKKKAKG